eukprot:scaffold598279_cov31-Prasinocladus_malaysianus.AAC.1
MFTKSCLRLLARTQSPTHSPIPYLGIRSILCSSCRPDVAPCASNIAPQMLRTAAAKSLDVFDVAAY